MNIHNGVLDSFEQIVYTKPSDIIINQIKNLIETGQLKSGEKLPSERQLSEKLSVSRSAVRDAIKKLEFYGILKTHPQSGTYVAGMGTSALQGLISEVLNMGGRDFKSLVETRVILEMHCAELACERRTETNIVKISHALEKYHDRVRLGLSTVEEDMMFHLEIAEAAQNPILKSLMMVMIPDIISSFVKYDVCSDSGGYTDRYEEHLQILEHIKNKDSSGARNAMAHHLKDIESFSLTNKI